MRKLCYLESDNMRLRRPDLWRTLKNEHCFVCILTLLRSLSTLVVQQGCFSL